MGIGLSLDGPLAGITDATRLTFGGKSVHDKVLTAMDALRGYACLWRRAAHGDATAAEWGDYTAHQFGWFEPARYVPLAKGAVHDAIIPSLREIGLVLPEAEVEALFGD